MKKYRQVTTELTFRCNAACPACHRIKPLRINLNDKLYTITLKNFKKLFYPEFLRNLDWMVLNGNFGDSIMNKEFREIISYVKEHDTRLLIHTNGGVHDTDYWTDVGNILTKRDIINFDLDGLTDTHSLYRINTNFEKVLSNAKAVIATGNTQVHWKYIVFSHNEHQVEEAKQMAKDLNFTTFSTVKSNRSHNPATNPEYIHIKRKTNLDELPKKIICSWGDYPKWYISPEGLVFRCCWTGGHYYDKDQSKFFYPESYSEVLNGFNHPIEKILASNYWDKLDQYLQGYDRAFTLCQNQCGKIVSSIEKTEENFETNSIKFKGNNDPDGQ